MKTYSAKPDEVKRNWWVVDADGKTLGRLATEVATVLRGKNKPQFTPHVDTGDFVVIINAAKVKLTGNKMHDKTYYHYSGYFGGMKSTTAEKLIVKKPELIIEFAVKGMLPKNALARKLMKKLKIYPGADHPHEAQAPKPMEVCKK